MSGSTRSGLTAALCTIFFASGAAALAFETLWFHQAGLAFGNSVWASALVLGAFMAGMALGNLGAARWGDRLRNPLGAYALIEVVVAVLGIALVYALPALSGLFAPLRTHLADQPAVLGTLRFGSAFVLLVVPAAGLGATLPLLVRTLGMHDPRFGRDLGLLYGVNTLGAVAGVLATEFLLIDAFGIRASAWCAGLLDLVAGIAAWSLRGAARPTETPPATRAAWRGVMWLGATFVAGLTLLALEVVWLRFLLLFLNDTPAAFALVLATVLTGIALGGLLGAAWQSRSQDAYRHAGFVALVAGLGGFGGYVAYPHVFNQMFASGQPASSILGVTAVLALPTSLASGALFTLLGAGLRDATDGDATASGRLTAFNTFGAAVGPPLAGFVLLPTFGMEYALFGLLVVYGLVGGTLMLRSSLAAPWRLGALLLFATILAAFPFGDMRERFIRSSAARWMTPGDEIVSVHEGTSNTIVHIRHRFAGLHIFDQIATNAYSMTVDDFFGRRYMRLFVLLPQVMHPRLERALLIGYGMGNTAQALVDDPAVKHVDVVDISREILRVAREIRPGPLDDPRVRLHIEDGRHFLAAGGEGYDLITGEPPPPTIAGVAALYSREYFELVHDRLREGGIATYWLPLMNITAATTRSIVAAFCDAFEDCSLWHGAARNFMLMGTRNRQVGLDGEGFARPWQEPRMRDALPGIGFETPGQLGALFIGDAAYLRELTADAPALVDDRPRLLHQPGTTEEHDELTWAWRDTTAARARFARSDSIARLFPSKARESALNLFDTQRLTNDLLWPGQTPARQIPVLHQVLTRTPLRLPVLLLLMSDPDIQRELRKAPAATRERPELLPHVLAGQLADRDFEAAAHTLERLDDRQLPMAGLRAYVEQARRETTPTE